MRMAAHEIDGTMPKRSHGLFFYIAASEPIWAVQSKFYQQKSRIFSVYPLKLCLRYPNRRKPSTQRKEIVTMSSKNTNKLNVPQARAAMDKFKMEAANEVGVNLKDGYNGDLTSREAGSVGGQMVKKMIESYEKNL